MATFGRHVQKLREAQGRSLRKVAKGIKKTPGYLSRIERNEVPPPSDEVIVALAEQLGEDPDVLFAMAGRVRPALREVICKRPRRFGALIEQLRHAPDEALDRLTRKVKDGNW